MQSAPPDRFDAAYYQRYYLDPRTSVAHPQHLQRLGAFVCSYVEYLRVPVARVLDLGCGIGLWQAVVARHFPRAAYQGVELSDYLCARHGWARGSVVDWRPQPPGVPFEPFDLVICQGVLPYLAPADLKAALANLGALCQGALYVEAVAREDYERGIVDEDLTDPALFRHRAALYRRGLAEHFLEMGGGVWLSRHADVPLFALEHCGA